MNSLDIIIPIPQREINSLVPGSVATMRIRGLQTKDTKQLYRILINKQAESNLLTVPTIPMFNMIMKFYHHKKADPDNLKKITVAAYLRILLKCQTVVNWNHNIIINYRNQWTMVSNQTNMEGRVRGL